MQNVREVAKWENQGHLGLVFGAGGVWLTRNIFFAGPQGHSHGRVNLRDITSIMDFISLRQNGKQPKCTLKKGMQINGPNGRKQILA